MNTIIVPHTMILPRALAETIAGIAKDHAPLECCGLLVGTGDQVVTVDEAVQAKNIASDQNARFEIDPQLQFDTLRRLRRSHRRVVGHFHSHPGGAAHPSRHDLAMAHDPETVWLIVAPDAAGAADFAAFRVTPNQSEFQPVVLVIEG